jgi:hypothetical protein
LQAEKLSYECENISESSCDGFADSSQVAFQLDKICMCLDTYPKANSMDHSCTSNEILGFISQHIEALQGGTSQSFSSVPNLLLFDAVQLSAHLSSSYVLESSLRRIENSFFEVPILFS